MKRCLILTGGKLSLAFAGSFLKEHKFEKVVAVDGGLEAAKELDIIPDVIVGDFDTVHPEILAYYRKMEHIVWEVHQPEKDDTDTQLGLSKTLMLYPEATITLIGATGGRIDHLLANLWLPLEPRFKSHAQQLVISDRQNHLTFYLPGEHSITQLPEMKYLAYCCLTPVTQLAIRKSKYELEPTDVSQPTSYASNEFISDTAEFSFLEGVVAVIQSRD